MPNTPTSDVIEPGLQSFVEQARADLARRTGLAMDQIEVTAAQSVTWPDGSLGCPQPGMMYTQVLVEGLLIRLRAAGREYEYHGGGQVAPFLCENKPG